MFRLSPVPSIVGYKKTSKNVWIMFSLFFLSKVKLTANWKLSSLSYSSFRECYDTRHSIHTQQTIVSQWKRVFWNLIRYFAIIVLVTASLFSAEDLRSSDRVTDGFLAIKVLLDCSDWLEGQLYSGLVVPNWAIEAPVYYNRNVAVISL